LSDNVKSVMPTYRLFRLREGLRAHFRQLPHLSGVAQLKPKDFEESEAFSAPSRYAAWLMLKDTEEPIRVGDALLEDEGALYVTKFVGMEPAEWILPEAKQMQVDIVPAADQAMAAASSL
jgi:hypothetical protein